MAKRFLDYSRMPLDASSPVPVDRPFTTAQAHAWGVSRRQLDLWVSSGQLARPIRGVFQVAQVPDSLDNRLAVLKCIVPEHAVVTDRTAGWLWGANMILAPGDHLDVPRAQVFCRPGLRLRNDLARSGERRMVRGDVVDLGGLRVTTPLRTACDLGRLLSRDQALAAMDSLAGLGSFDVPDLVRASEGYRGYRGVRQLRALAPLVDAGAASPPESILRLRWMDAGLPRPVCQVPVLSPTGSLWWLDMGLPGERLAAEYDGVDFHGQEHRERDRARRAWIREVLGWHVVVVTKDNLFGPDRDVEQMLVQAAHDVRLWTNAHRPVVN